MKSALVVALVTAATSGCWSGDYLAKQGLGQLRLLRARRRIEDVLHDPSVDPETKRRLRLAKAARDFGVRVIGCAAATPSPASSTRTARRSPGT